MMAASEFAEYNSARSMVKTGLVGVHYFPLRCANDSPITYLLVSLMSEASISALSSGPCKNVTSSVENQSVTTPCETMHYRECLHQEIRIGTTVDAAQLPPNPSTSSGLASLRLYFRFAKQTTICMVHCPVPTGRVSSLREIFNNRSKNRSGHGFGLPL